MESKSTTVCPICLGTHTGGNNTLLYLPCGNLDGSLLYPSAKVLSCLSCGHVYNSLSSQELSDLERYYPLEYSIVNSSSSSTHGDLPGSRTANSRGRYEGLHHILHGYYTQDNTTVADIGCASGGYLSYVISKHSNVKAIGVDPSEVYVDLAKRKGLNVVVGSATNTGLDGSSVDVVIMDQVLEHLSNPKDAMTEAGRILKDNGVFCISVPDAARYNMYPFFDYYWFLMREHIQHFDLEHLSMLADYGGFHVVSFHRGLSKMMSDTMILPYLTVILQKGTIGKGKDPSAKLRIRMEEYIESQEKRRAGRTAIGAMPNEYIWGIGREFLYLVENNMLHMSKETILVDSNTHKQEHVTYRGNRIHSPAVIPRHNRNQTVVITATAYTNEISRLLLDDGYHGSIITV